MTTASTCSGGLCGLAGIAGVVAGVVLGVLSLVLAPLFTLLAVKVTTGWRATALGVCSTWGVLGMATALVSRWL